MNAETAELLTVQFYTGSRSDGSTFITADTDSAARDLVQFVHFHAFDGMLPNDWVYEKVRALLQCSAEGYDPYTDMPVDVGTYQLVTWAASHALWQSLVNEAMEAEHYTNLKDACIAGQLAALEMMTAAIEAWTPEDARIAAQLAALEIEMTAIEAWTPEDA